MNTAEYYSNIKDEHLQYRSGLIDKLIDLGGDALATMLTELQAENHESAHYYKGKFQALKEVAYNLFGVDHTDYRAQCALIANICRLDAKHTGEVPNE